MLRSIELFHVVMPLRKPIAHASHTRAHSDNLVVRATLDDGTVGYGEGVPREYVTGETIASNFEDLAGVDAATALGRPESFAEAVHRIAIVSVPASLGDYRGMGSNAARCALEMALLDAVGRRFGASVGDAVRLMNHSSHIRGHPSPMPVCYSGAITAETRKKERISAWKMRLYGFHQVKIKVGVDGQDDPARLASFRKILGRKVDIRLDANEAWPAAGLVERVAPLLPFRPSALEQPVPHAEVDELAALRPLLGVPIMLDESLCGFPDAMKAIHRGTADILNIRLSKCGGFAHSIRIMAAALSHGLGVQLGCHPGESGLLSAAGRHLASNVGPFRYIEGSYDRHVLTRNLIKQDITFGYGGRAPALRGPGLGVEVDVAALESLTVDRRLITYG